MAVRVITAPPGAGKTLNMSRIALQLFNENNNLNIFSSYIIKKFFKKKIFYNNIYSNYPILLLKKDIPFDYISGSGNLVHACMINKDGFEYSEEDLKLNKKKYYGCFSNIIHFTDMRLKYKFCENACFFIDEISFIYDSQEYRDFPDCIAHFFFIHRHLGYYMIYTNSQSLSRIIKRVLCVSEEFWNVVSLKKFLFWSRVEFKITTEEKESKNSENSSDDLNADYVAKWFISKRVYDSYYTKYLGSLNEGLPFYDKGNFISKSMNKQQIIDSFLVTEKEKQELKDMIF